jgi:hypothetical protein
MYAVESDYLKISALYGQNFASTGGFTWHLAVGPTALWRISSSDNEAQLFQCETFLPRNIRTVDELLRRMEFQLSFGTGTTYAIGHNVVATADLMFTTGFGPMELPEPSHYYGGGDPSPLARGAYLVQSKSRSLGLRIGVGYLFE